MKATYAITIRGGASGGVWYHQIILFFGKRQFRSETKYSTYSAAEKAAKQLGATKNDQ